MLLETTWFLLSMKISSVCLLPTENLNLSTDFVEYEAIKLISVEFPKSLNPSGHLPCSILVKVKSRYSWTMILVRNVNAPKLFDGTGFLIKFLKKYPIEADILTDCAKCLSCTCFENFNDTDECPFEFKRFQFPVKLFFAITCINKT